ncbi:hypothetical protein C7999DRAFT_18435, partial [Corynascus novoguineensis]
RYDYFPQLAKFVLRMPGTIREAAIGQIERLVIEQLIDIQRGNDQVAADFARKVVVTGSPDTVTTDGGSHCPDGSFTYEDARAACVVLEVSHSQKRRDLPFLADKYILGSDGQTQVVIRIDLEYRKNKGKEARLLVWRPRFTEEDGRVVLEAAKTETGIFRAVDGSLVNGERILRIGLKDFGFWPDCLGIDDISGEVTISFSQLYEIVQMAEARKECMDRGRREVNYLKRRRVRSPPE